MIDKNNTFLNTQVPAANERANTVRKQILEDLVPVYTRDGTRIPVKLNSQAYISKDASYISVVDSSYFQFDNTTGPEELQFQVDTVCHEAWHYNESDLHAREEFVKEKKIAPKVAGVVINTVEDHYIDWKRMQEFSGQIEAYVNKLQTFVDEEFGVFKPLDSMSRMEKFLNGFVQVSLVGFPVVDDMSTIEDDQELLAFLTWVRERVRDVRDMTPERQQEENESIPYSVAIVEAQSQRKQLASEIADVLLSHFIDGLDQLDSLVDTIERFEISVEAPTETNPRPISEEERVRLEKINDEIPEPSPGSVDTSTQSTDIPNNSTGEDSDTQIVDGEGGDSSLSNNWIEQPGTTKDSDKNPSENGDTASKGSSQVDESQDSNSASHKQQTDKNDNSETNHSQLEQEETDTETVCGESDGTDNKHNKDSKSSTETGNSGQTEYSNDDHGVTRISQQRLSDSRDRMVGAADKKSVAKVMDVSPDELATCVDDTLLRQYQRIEIERNTGRDDLLVRTKRRNRRASELHPQVTSEVIKKEVQNGEIADKIEKTFRKLKTRDTLVTSDKGERLNMDGIISNRASGSNRKPAYQTRRQIEVGDRTVCVSLDASGSMDEEKAKCAIGAVYTATDIIGDEFCANSFYSNEKNTIYTPLITAPSEDFSWEHLDSISSGGMTPTASGVIDATNILEQASRPQKTLIVITDGRPNLPPNANIRSDGKTGDIALDSAASAVEDARNKGITVIGIGVGKVNQNNFKTIFGPKGYVVANTDTLAQELLHVYKNQMNLVKRGII